MVTWSVEVPRPQRYAVRMEWACPDESAGNNFVLRAPHGWLTGKVAGTGTAGAYRHTRVGEMTLQAGPQRLSFEPLGKLSGPLLTLRSISLTPVAEE